jgi:hypothetical protein
MVWAALGVIVTSVAAWGGPAGSRAAWWFARDSVKPIADLVNTAEAGKAPRFGDSVGSFRADVSGRAIRVTGKFPTAGVWRFDLTTFDGRFDMRQLYVPYGSAAYPNVNSIHTRRLAKLLGSADKALTHTGPWEIFNGQWKVPTARVALDDKHIYTSWFDLPSLDDQKAGRVYASFALEIGQPGKHTIRISFDDFPHHTRWRPERGKTDKPKVTYTPNPLRPQDIGSIAIGPDEREASLSDIRLKPELVGKHPRLTDRPARADKTSTLTLRDREVQQLIIRLDPDRGELWEYSDDAESMASGNDMDAGRKGLDVCRIYDRLAGRLDKEARLAVDKYFLKRFEGIYTYFVFQRNYNATGYAQNHNSKAVWALVGAGLVWDGPEAKKWLRWATMICRKRVELLARDGGLEWMNEARHYGLGFWETSRQLIRRHTGVDLAKGAFFTNEWRYALHNAPQFPADHVPIMTTPNGKQSNANLPLPDRIAPETTPTGFHFDDCDQVFMRSDWGKDALRMRLTAGSVFGRTGAAKALRYNWAHCPVNRGSIAIWKGPHKIILEPGWDRTYRKTAANNNCILVNDTDQWGGGQVWHPRLNSNQVGQITMFADGKHLSVARVDLKNAYPPGARIGALSRVLVYLKPDHILIFDRLEPVGKGKAQWRYHGAFIEPTKQAGRFTVFGFERIRQKGGTKPESYEKAFTRLGEVSLEVAFLTPGPAAAVGTSDVYFRGNPFRQPMRHLRVVRNGSGAIQLLTAFAPKLRLAAAGQNSFTGTQGDVSWTVVLGGKDAGALSSDAHLAVAARNRKSGLAEVFRFGGRRIKLDKVDVPADGVDLFAAIRNGKVIRTVSSKQSKTSAPRR